MPLGRLLWCSLCQYVGGIWVEVLLARGNGCCRCLEEKMRWHVPWAESGVLWLRVRECFECLDRLGHRRRL